MLNSDHKEIHISIPQLGHTIFEEVISIFDSTSLPVQLLHFGYVIYEEVIAPYYAPRKQSLGGYIGITLSVRPSMYLSGLLDFYETLHICSTLPADVHEGIWLLSKI